MPLCYPHNFDQMHLGLKCFKISLVVVSNVSVALLSFCTYETQKSNTLCSNAFKFPNDFTRSLLWTAIPPVLRKIIKINDFAIFFSCYYLSLCNVLFNYTIFTVFLPIFAISHVLFCYQLHVLFCYQSRTFFCYQSRTFFCYQ